MEFFLIASAHFLALLSPGPDFFLILQNSLKHPPRYGFTLCCGIAAANGLYILIAVLGLEVLREIGWLSQLLKYCGGGYLIYLGGMLLKAPRSSGEARMEAVGGHLPASPVRFWWMGFMSALLNPKNGLFYLSLFTVMVSSETSLPQKGFYGLWMIVVVLLWDCAMVLLVGSASVRGVLGKGVFLVEKVAGVALTCFGAMLPFS